MFLCVALTQQAQAMLILACVLSAAVQDWQDLGIIFAMLFLNACIAFYEVRSIGGQLIAFAA